MTARINDGTFDGTFNVPLKKYRHMPLTNTQVSQSKPQEKDYKLSDVSGLYLLVKKSGAKYWRMDYRINGKRPTLALGVYPAVSLKQARAARDVAKEQIAQGIDPSRKKKQDKLQARATAVNTFERVAREWHKSKADSDTWKEKHAIRVMTALEKRAFPFIGDIPLAEVTAPDVLAVLRKMESEGIGEATRRVKQWISDVFLFAIAEGRVMYNPVNGLEKALKPMPKVQHQKRLKVDELGGFMRDLEGYDGDLQTILGLKLIVFTFVRTSELRFAQWSEFDLDNALWEIPAEHMKMDEAHIVPLSHQAVEVLRQLQVLNGNHKHVLPSPVRRMKPISENTLIGAIYRLGYKSRTTVHGFRGVASTALNEAGFNKDVIERQLAHAERNKIRAAYNHAEYMQDRTKMMQWWADKVDSLVEGGNILYPNFGES